MFGGTSGKQFPLPKPSVNGNSISLSSFETGTDSGDRAVGIIKAAYHDNRSSKVEGGDKVL